MSTFNGIVSEFPDIRIDFFRKTPSANPPLACFLSHVHSDHLQGLESLKAPFIYCSSVTRALLLRIEKYPHRMNYIKGVLESRKQHYKHLNRLLKCIPLNCPTEVELRPLLTIRVTLFDANHCPGAVMFLIEGQGRAVLYTGDVRAEPWWVNSLVRDPVLLPFTTQLRVVDRIYLDTTFAIKDDVYSRFPSKGQGLSELLHRVMIYPPDTVFYLSAWTLGYEEVWIALSTLLKSKVHVESYHLGLYSSESQTIASNSSSARMTAAAALPTSGSTLLAALTGYVVGNHDHAGCLTDNPKVRIHSCEPGTKCYANLQKSQSVVWITPIISRSETGVIIPELGAGGGGGDLFQQPELDVGNVSLTEIENLITSHVPEGESRAQIMARLSKAWASREKMMTLDGIDLEDEETTLSHFFQLLSHARSDVSRSTSLKRRRPVGFTDATSIGFPYARHSSYEELRGLVSAFKPRDIYPCTLHESSWAEDVSMRTLFGDLCSDNIFEHDSDMTARKALEREVQSPNVASSQGVAESSPNSDTSTADLTQEDLRSYHNLAGDVDVKPPLPSDATDITPARSQQTGSQTGRDTKTVNQADANAANIPTEGASRISEAYWAALSALDTNDCAAWDDLGMLSAGHGHTKAEQEL